MPTVPLPDWVLQEAVDLHWRHRTTPEAAKYASELTSRMEPTGRVGIPRDTFSHRIAVAARKGIGPNKSDVQRNHKSPPQSPSLAADDPRPADEKPRYRLKTDGTAEPINDAARNAPLAIKERLRYENRIVALSRQVREAAQESLTADSVRSAVFGLRDIPREPPAWVFDTSRTSAGSPGVPATIWSDWHCGERVSRDETGGVNEFNLEIADRRIKTLVDRTIDLCFRHMVTPEYPGIVVMLGGDMLSGDDLHDELTDTNEMKTAPTLVWLEARLAQALEILADHFGRVFVAGVVGNHGRNTRKPRAKLRVFTSYEWLLYQFLERRFAGDDRITFMIPNEADARFQIAGRRYLLTHGDALGVKGGDGIIGSLGPIMRGEVKLSKAEAQIGRDFDTLVMGHWHDYLTLRGRIIVNGTLKGFDEYARLLLRATYQPPIQALWWTHPKWGITCHWPIYLDDAQSIGAPEWAGRLA